MTTTWRGQWALVTGASSGIGAEFARQLALSGTNLVLTARRADRLEALADKLHIDHGIQVETFSADLELASAPSEIYRFVAAKNIEIGLLINNAGFGSFGEFSTLDAEREAAMVNVNCVAVVRLTHLFLPGMIARRKGGILIVASTASFQPIPYLATYAATKVFDRFFAEALAEELKPRGIHVCALSPGPTTSEFFKVATIPTMGKSESVDVVVARGLEALAQGKSSKVSGFGNWFGTEIQRLVPRGLVTAMVGRMFRSAIARQH